MSGGQGLTHPTWVGTLLRQESRERNPSAAGMLWRQQLLLGFRCPLSSHGGAGEAGGRFERIILLPREINPPPPFLSQEADPGVDGETKTNGKKPLT